MFTRSKSNFRFGGASAAIAVSTAAVAIAALFVPPTAATAREVARSVHASGNTGHAAAVHHANWSAGHPGAHAIGLHGAAWHSGAGAAHDAVWHEGIGHMAPVYWHGGYGGHWVHGWHGGTYGWWWFNAGVWWPYYAWGYPYAPPYEGYPAPYYYPPAVANGNLPPPPQYWYYCDAARGYYPNVPSCPGGWRPVPANPAQSGEAAPAPEAAPH